MTAPEIEWEVMGGPSIPEIKQSLGLPATEVVSTAIKHERPIRPAPVPIKRPRGRPRKNPLPVEETEDISFPVPDPVGGGGVSERELQKKLANMMVMGTGIGANLKPYLQMTDDEAEAISVPLASYLHRNAAENPVVKQIVENYDLLGIGIGTGAYVVRVARDRASEKEEFAPQPSLSDRVRSLTRYRQNQSEVSDNGEFSNPDGENVWNVAGLSHNGSNGNL